MTKADKIEKKILTIAKWGAGIWAAVAAVSLIDKRVKAAKNPIEGIGATKRRIYKELSLAQQAGVDFTKPYEELTKDEIKALQRVSNETGYTETYYKSLQKAYNAISGIGEAYDVVNADGDTVLTWIEDPETHKGTVQVYDDPERYAALREAHDIEDERQWAVENKSRAMDEMEAQLAEQRKRLKKSGRSSQMALFGCGYADDPVYSKRQMISYLTSHRDIDVQVDLSDVRFNSAGWVLCGDEQGGRSFYVGKENLKWLQDYCVKHNIPFEAGYARSYVSSNPEAVEHELYEIWREQIEYGDTEYDYPTWRDTIGDEYVQDVIKYMK